jgi:Zn-dependent peptidase ImmA (M78 family)
VAFRRGFKTEANSIATEIRAEIGLQALEALDPWGLAKHLAIPVIPLSELARDATGAAYLLDTEPEAFSAVTVFHGSHRTIVHNDAHAPGRQASNLTHELAHGILLHTPAPALDHRGCRAWNQDIEDEAEWLAGALLIPEDAALWIARQSMPSTRAAVHFGATPKMVQYRLNVTGARVRVARAQRRRTG